MASHNHDVDFDDVDDASATPAVDMVVDNNGCRGWDPIDIRVLANSDLPRPSMVRHSTSGPDDVVVVVAIAIVVDVDPARSFLLPPSLATMRRHSTLCPG